MTRAVRGGFFKDDTSSVISDHLRNHVHLTNCIHLKNHLHRHSPVMAERYLMRDLILLQRSRSLRDPLTSPRAWQTPPMAAAGAMPRNHQRDGLAHGARRSIGAEHQKDGARVSAGSAWLPSASKSKVADEQASYNRSDQCKGVDIGKASKEEEPATVKGHKNKFLSDRASGKAEAKCNDSSRKDNKVDRTEDRPHFTDIESAILANNFHHRRLMEQENICGDPQSSAHGNGSGRVKRRGKFRGTRRGRSSADRKERDIVNDLSAASNSLARGSMHHKCCLGRGEEAAEANVARGPSNGCGLPWNWSRIHHRGKHLLDMAGRSLACGRSELRMRKEAYPIPQSQRDNSDIPTAADQSCSSAKSDSDTLPLLSEPCGSPGSAGDPHLDHSYSGELGLFSGQSEQDYDLAHDSRFDNERSVGCHQGRHRSLTQKYMPKTFKDLVGQNLVIQALSNAVLRKRICLVYVFYGPQGTGKTSCARIFARALNCKSTDHPKPCGMCTSCVSDYVGKNHNFLEVCPIGNFDFESVVDAYENKMLSSLSSQYSVFIIDECDTLAADSWSAISRVIDRAPRRVVFLLITNCLEHLPHIITSRCQKFFFPKLKDVDIIYKLQWIASKERLEIHKDALKLVASRSEGSLRDAEMMLDQLSLLGQRISLSLVQELVGLVSDEKLVDLLDLALSADTINTVKGLREIMEAGVEPLALMSQLATIITDILAGSYVFTRERLRRKFFNKTKLSKEDMEKLRQALKALSEAEKQLRTSHDKLTWLTAALLQLAPDQQYMLPDSSADTSFSHSPMLLHYNDGREVPENSSKWDNIPNSERRLSGITVMESHRNRGSNSGFNISKVDNTSTASKKMPATTSALSAEVNQDDGGYNLQKGFVDAEKIWMAVIERLQISSLRKLMNEEGKLVSVNFGAAPTVRVMFSSSVSKSKAEKFRGQILQAFESVLCTAVTLEIRCGTLKVKKLDTQLPEVSYTNEWTIREKSGNQARRLSKNGSVKVNYSTPGHAKHMASNMHDNPQNEIVEITDSPHKHMKRQQAVGTRYLEEDSSSRHQNTLINMAETKEGCTQGSGWSKRKAISIAEKLEQENLRLEPRSRSLLCWKTPRITRAKLLRMRIRPRRPHGLLKLVSCGRCSCARTPR